MITLPTPAGQPKIKVFESLGGTVTHYSLSNGVTVRIGLTGVLACLGTYCRLQSTKCEHVEYVRPLHREYEAEKLAAEVAVG